MNAHPGPKNQLPSTLSADAGLWIVARARMIQEDPRLAGMIPVLVCATSYLASDNAGKPIEFYNKPFYSVRFDDPEEMPPGTYAEFSVLGISVFVHAHAISEEFQGRHLILDVVDVGIVKGQRTTMEVLRAV